MACSGSRPLNVQLSRSSDPGGGAQVSPAGEGSCRPHPGVGRPRENGPHPHRQTVRLFFGHEVGRRRDLGVLIERGLADRGREGRHIDEASDLRIGAGLGDDAAVSGMADEDCRAILPFQHSADRCDIVGKRDRQVLHHADGIAVGCRIKRSYQRRSSPRAIFERVSHRPKRQASACRHCFPTTRPPHTDR